MRALQNVYVRQVLEDGRTQVVWRHDELQSSEIKGPTAFVTKDRTDGEFKAGDRAQAVVETDTHTVERLIHHPGRRA